LARARLAPQAFASRDRQQVAVLLCLEQVALVGTVLDFAADALPILLERIVALNDRLQLEALGGVADLLAAQQVNAPIHVFARDRGLDALDAHEVLLVERAQALEPGLQLFDRYFELGGFHSISSARQGLDDQVVEADGGFPVVEGEVVVPDTKQRLRIAQA
jgi:hypothetical protein